MEPVSVAATFITLATFIKDLIEVGESIHRSIEKVGENRRQIRELTEEVVRTLYDLANLTRGREETFQGSELLSALEDLKAEMFHVHSKCLKITPIQLPDLRGIGSQLKAWRKRDDLEGKIGRLKERVNKCYRQFTAFSAARIEKTTLRIEQTLIVANVENQVKARRLEGMMAQLLLETEFGQNKMIQMIQIIEADPTHESLESRYLSAQTMCLVDLVQRLLTGGKLVLHAPLSDPTQSLQLVYADTRSTLHVLHWILGTVIEIRESPSDRIPLSGPIKDILRDLGVYLNNIGMTSESIIWERLNLQVLLSLDCAAAISPEIATSLEFLSSRYHRQNQFQAALQASQQSLDLWRHICESLPDVDHRIGLLTALVTHTQNLLETSQKMTALFTAQDAAAISRPMVEELINSSSGLSSQVLNKPDKHNAEQCRNSLFNLAQALASLDHHLESYEAFKEGFQTFLSLPIGKYPPSGKDINSFINEICNVAEGGGFSLAMLSDSAVLFRDLTRMHPEQFSSQFLRLLHAYVYFAQQDNSSGTSPSMQDIRIFLEPKLDRPPPKLDVTRSIQFDFGARGAIQIDNVVRAYYAHPLHTVDVLILNIFVVQFDQAIAILQAVIEKSASEGSTISWVLHSINSIVPFVSNANQKALLQLLTRTFKNWDTYLAGPRLKRKSCLLRLKRIFRHFWRVGLLDDASGLCQQTVRYLESCSDARDTGIAHLSWVFILCDMARVSLAVEVIHGAKKMHQLSGNGAEGCDPNFLLSCIIQTRILQYTGRSQEALQLLKKGVADGHRLRKSRTNDSKDFNIHLHFLIVELAAAWGIAGRRETALEVAEKVVKTCRKRVVDKHMQEQKCILVHSLTTLSNCLVTVGKNDEALNVAQEAASIYTHNVANMWQAFLHTIRKEELGANAFHALSRRLATCGNLEQALLHAEEATALYRQLVQLAPRHLPTLATSLRNLASVLRDVGCRDQATAHCEEAVSILRNVVKSETYFLPALAKGLDQLSVYLTEKGDIDGALATTAECAEVRRQFAALLPQPEFLFEKVEVSEADGEDDGIEEWETVSKAEYHDEWDAANVGARVSGTACSRICGLPSPAPTPEELEMASEADGDDELDAATSVGTRLSGTACASISELPSLTQTPDLPLQGGVEDDTDILGGMNESAMSPIAKESPTTTDTTFPAKSRFTDILSKPIEAIVSYNSEFGERTRKRQKKISAEDNARPRDGPHLAAFPVCLSAIMSSPFALQLGTNYCPRDDELPQIQALLIEPSQRLKNLDDEIAVIRKALDKLSEERDALSAYVEGHRALMAPIRRLPLDILEEIFVACLPSHRNCVMSAEEAPVILGRICSSWRTISLATPRLWSRLHIVEPRSPEPSNPLHMSRRLLRLEVANSWLRRSGECPLSISLDSSPDPRISPPLSPVVSSTNPDLFLSTLIQFAPRWQSISLVTQQLALKTLSRVTENDVPLLQELTIICLGATHHTDDAPWSLSQSSVFHGLSLSAVSISGSTAKASELPLRWSQLTALSFLGSAWGTEHVQTCGVLLEILSRCPKLRTCSLLIDEPPGDLTHSIVECPFLHTLYLFCAHAAVHTSGSLLSRLSLPDLREFTLHGSETVQDGDPSTTNSLTSALAASPRLETIHIASESFTKSTLIDFLRGLSSTIRHLDISESIHIAWRLEPALDDHVLTALTTYCPTLRELVLLNCHSVSDEALLCFIISRKPALKRIQVKFARERQVDILPSIQSFTADGLESSITYKYTSKPLNTPQSSPWHGLPDAPPHSSWQPWPDDY
ncbi:Tetratricopeptide repeat family [Mycena venus]|uniref:Tetratricopeptide repeat family n=1 Tax=Mycena venus TaxID=2733690 RepID=A0A8H7D1E3_9AGAR|nr:Tetratricopeptide repeat family [Mycena venus]